MKRKIQGLVCLLNAILMIAGQDAMATPVAHGKDWRVVQARDFEAIPNDGKCDAEAIREAVASVADQSGVRLLFEEGVYNLKESSVAERGKRLAMVHLWGHEDWVLEGAVDAQGDPATVLEMNLKLRNEVTGARHLDIRDCKTFALKNVVLDQNPRMATAAEVIEVNRSSGLIKIRMRDGMPHFDGMASFSANNWDLKTGLMIPGPAVSIGVDARRFGKWSVVKGQSGVYSLTNKSMAKLLKVGQGLSFHFNIVIPQGRTLDVYHSEDVVLENIFVHNAIGMIMGGGDNRNLTFKRFHIKPEGNSLAVGPRDGIHMNRSHGRLLMEDVVVKGVRWDPIVSYKHYGRVGERVGNRSVRLDPKDSKSSLVLRALKPGDQLHFWSGIDPTVREIAALKDGLISFTEDLDPSVKAGVVVTPGVWHWDEAIIRNSKLEANYGTAIVYESDNLLVENCAFNNNAYTNIGLGPTSRNAGMFCRNITIRNNTFKASTWEPKYRGSYLAQHRGTITLFNSSASLEGMSYHRNILIEGNLFKDLTGRNKPAAIDAKLAKGVLIRNNRYENVASPNHVDAKTTSQVTVEEAAH